MSIKNSCEKCVFAIRDEDGNQTDCEFGRLGDYEDYYAARGPATLEMDEDFGKVQFDADAKSYEIIGRLCNLSRSRLSPWLEKIPEDEWAQKSFEESRLRFKVVILVMEDAAVEDLVASLHAAQAQSLPPVSVNFVLASPLVSRAKLTAALEGEEYAGIRRILTPDQSFWQCLDEESSASTDTHGDFNYVCAIEPGKAMRPDYLESVDYLVNKKMEIVSLMVPDDGFHGAVYSMAVREGVGRDYDSTMREKIESTGGTVWRAECE